MHIIADELGYEVIPQVSSERYDSYECRTVYAYSRFSTICVSDYQGRVLSKKQGRITPIDTKKLERELVALGFKSKH